MLKLHLFSDQRGEAKADNEDMVELTCLLFDNCGKHNVNVIKSRISTLHPLLDHAILN